MLRSHQEWGEILKIKPWAAPKVDTAHIKLVNRIIMVKSEIVAKPEKLKTNTQINEKESAPQKANPSKQTQGIVKRIRQRLFSTSKDKEWLKQIHIGLEEGRKAAMLNVYKK